MHEDIMTINDLADLINRSFKSLHEYMDERFVTKDEFTQEIGEIKLSLHRLDSFALKTDIRLEKIEDRLEGLESHASAATEWLRDHESRIGNLESAR